MAAMSPTDTSIVGVEGSCRDMVAATTATDETDDSIHIIVMMRMKHSAQKRGITPATGCHVFVTKPTVAQSCRETRDGRRMQ